MIYLSKICLNFRCKEARRDLSDPYELHSTLCRAFSTTSERCPEGEFLWRLESSADPLRRPTILIQSRSLPVWDRIGLSQWLEDAKPTINLWEHLNLASLESGSHFRFRLRANPCVSRDQKRVGLMRINDQLNWLVRKGSQHGFVLSSKGKDSNEVERYLQVQVSEGALLKGRQRKGNLITLFSVLFDGFLVVTDPREFVATLRRGIGRGKALGQGMLSVVPVDG